MTQREMFEKWASAPPRKWLVRKHPNQVDFPDQYYLEFVQWAWEAFQAACPEGWQAVPIKPTSTMKKAADLDTPGPMTAFKCWEVMLSVAPEPNKEDD